MKIFNFILYIGFCLDVFAQGVPVNYLAISEEMLENIESKQEVSIQMKTLAMANENQLASQLGTDAQKIAFWVNIYNAYIQLILTKEPGKYNDRASFFKRETNQYCG